MTDKNDALFLVCLPFGQKTIPYEEVPELIAMAKSPGYDCEKASEHEAVMLALGVCQEEGPLKAAVRAGEVEVLSKSLHRMGPPFIGRLEDTVLTVRALREYVESINGFLEIDDAPEPQTTTPSPAPVVAAGTSGGDELWKEQARARAYEIIKRDKAKDLYPSQLNIADEIAKQFRRDGLTGADGKPLAGAYIKRHALKGISSAQSKLVSTVMRQSK